MATGALPAGTAKLAHVVICATKDSETEEGQDLTTAETLWEIEPTGGYASGRKVEEIGEIQYGVVPAGYKQIRPQNGGPPPLATGNKYEYWFDTADAPHARNCFIIRGNRCVEVMD